MQLARGFWLRSGIISLLATIASGASDRKAPSRDLMVVSRPREAGSSKTVLEPPVERGLGWSWMCDHCVSGLYLFLCLVANPKEGWVSRDSGACLQPQKRATGYGVEFLSPRVAVPVDVQEPCSGALVTP